MDSVEKEQNNQYAIPASGPNLRSTQKKPDTPMTAPTGWQAWLPVVLGLSLLVGGIYGQTLGFDFVNFDDDDYITGNPSVLAGLCGASIRWAFTTFHAANWHPLTWLSHLLDISLFGLWAGGHHAMNAGIHLATTLLLFYFLFRTTNQWGRSALVAALFAVHPLHVESVAWIAERKDLLCGLFWIGSFSVYAWAVRDESAQRRLLAVAGMMALALLSKPMAVTLPFTLLLLDVWPLRRLSFFPESAEGTAAWLRLWARRIAEKWLLLLLSAGSCLVTLWAQSRGGAVKTLTLYPMSVRLGNALLAYAGYVRRFCWPTRLCVFYPHPGAGYSRIGAAVAALLLLAVTLLLLRAARRRPELLVGWLWFVGVLIPVIGLVQVGSQALADRYMYIPLIGLAIMLAWAFPTPKTRQWRQTAWVGSCLVIGALTLTAMIQTTYWRDSTHLFTRALDCGGASDLVHNNLGIALADQNQLDAAISHYQQALKLNPNNFRAWNNLGEARMSLGLNASALPCFLQALKLAPGYWQAQYNLGICLAGQGRLDAALRLFKQILRQHPNQAVVHNYTGIVLARSGRVTQAIQAFRQALKLNPRLLKARMNLGVALASLGQFDAAIKQLREVLLRDPHYAAARANLARVLANQKRAREKVSNGHK